MAQVDIMAMQMQYITVGFSSGYFLSPRLPSNFRTSHQLCTPDPLTNILPGDYSSFLLQFFRTLLVILITPDVDSCYCCVASMCCYRALDRVRILCHQNVGFKILTRSNCVGPAPLPGPPTSSRTRQQHVHFRGRYSQCVNFHHYV